MSLFPKLMTAILVLLVSFAASCFAAPQHGIGAAQTTSISPSNNYLSYWEYTYLTDWKIDVYGEVQRNADLQTGQSPSSENWVSVFCVRASSVYGTFPDTCSKGNGTFKPSDYQINSYKMIKQFTLPGDVATIIGTYATNYGCQIELGRNCSDQEMSARRLQAIQFFRDYVEDEIGMITVEDDDGNSDFLSSINSLHSDSLELDSLHPGASQDYQQGGWSLVGRIIGKGTVVFDVLMSGHDFYVGFTEERARLREIEKERARIQKQIDDAEKARDKVNEARINIQQQLSQIECEAETKKQCRNLPTQAAQEACLKCLTTKFKLEQYLRDAEYHYRDLLEKIELLRQALTA